MDGLFSSSQPAGVYFQEQNICSYNNSQLKGGGRGGEQQGCV